MTQAPDVTLHYQPGTRTGLAHGARMGLNLHARLCCMAFKQPGRIAIGMPEGLVQGRHQICAKRYNSSSQD